MFGLPWLRDVHSQHMHSCTRMTGARRSWPVHGLEGMRWVFSWRALHASICVFPSPAQPSPSISLAASYRTTLV